MADGQHPIANSCPKCGNEVDPLRSPAVTILNGRIVHFCSSACRAAFMDRAQVTASPTVPQITVNDPQETQPPFSTEPDVLPVSPYVIKPSARAASRFPLVERTFEIARIGQLAMVIIAALILWNPFHLRTAILSGAIGLATLLLIAPRLNTGLRNKLGFRIIDELAFPMIAIFCALTAVAVAHGHRWICAGALFVLLDPCERFCEELAVARLGLTAVSKRPYPQNPWLAWRDDSLVAEIVTRLSRWTTWFRLPAALLASLAIYFFAGHGGESALMAGAGIFAVLHPRIFISATYLPYLATSYAIANWGIYVRGAKILENIGASETVVFMPGNTLLEKKLTVVDWHLAEDQVEPMVLHHLGSLETAATGAIANAIVQFVQSKGARNESVSDFHYEKGLGVAATAHDVRMYCGSRTFLLQHEISTALLEDSARLIEASGRRALFFALDDQALALFGLDEKPLLFAAQIILRLKHTNKVLVLVTSAEVDAATAMGERLGIENVRFGTTMDKIGKVLDDIASCAGNTLLIGNGEAFEENLHLARAAIAIGDTEPTQAGIDAGTLPMTELPTLIEFADRAHRAARRNLIFASAVVAFGTCLALSWYSPFTPVAIGVGVAGSAVFSALSGPFIVLEKLQRTISAAVHRAYQSIAKRLSI